MPLYWCQPGGRKFIGFSPRYHSRNNPLLFAYVLDGMLIVKAFLSHDFHKYIYSSLNETQRMADWASDSSPSSIHLTLRLTPSLIIVSNDKVGSWKETIVFALNSFHSINPPLL